MKDLINFVDNGVLGFPSGSSDSRLALRAIAAESATGEPASGQIRFARVGNEEGYWYLFDHPVADIADFDAGSLPSGNRIVTLGGEQTLTNKSLITPTIASFVNAGHDHSNVAGGGTLSHNDLTLIGITGHDDIDDHIAGATVHGVTGVVVGTQGAQTLAQKTLTNPIIASFINATHDHADAAGGGQITKIVEESLSDIFDRSKGTMTIINDGPTLGMEWGINDILRLYWKIPFNIDTSFNPQTFMELHMDTTQTASTSFGFKWAAASMARQEGASVGGTTESITTNFESGTEDDIIVNRPLDPLIGKFTWGATAMLVTGSPMSVAFSFNRRTEDAGSSPVGNLVVTNVFIKYQVFVT